MDYVSIPSSTEALFAEFWGQSWWRELSDSAICSCTWDFSILQFSLHYHSGLVWPLPFPHNCFIFSISLLSQMYLGHIPTSRYGGCQLIKTPLSHWKYYFYFVRFFLAVTTRIDLKHLELLLAHAGPWINTCWKRLWLDECIAFRFGDIMSLHFGFSLSNF